MMIFFIVLPIALPIVLRQQPGPGPDRLGLKCYLAWGGTRVVGGGGKRGGMPYQFSQKNKHFY